MATVEKPYATEEALKKSIDLTLDALSDKVDHVPGKGLSTNDYTDAEKAKLAGIAEGANNYTLPTASASTKGGVVIGDGLSIDENGVVSANTAGEFVEITPSEVRSMWTGEEVALIPVMTAASDATGSVSYGNSYGSGMYGVQNPWLPFDGNDSTCLYYANENVTDGWLQYQFNTPQLVTTIKALFGNYLASNNIPATLYVYDINGNEIEKGNVVVTGWNEGSYGEYTFPVNMIVSKFKFVFGYKQNATNIMTYTVQAYTLAT